MEFNSIETLVGVLEGVERHEFGHAGRVVARLDGRRVGHEQTALLLVEVKP